MKAKYSHNELENAFFKIRPKRDWRNPIKATIDSKDIDITREAIRYFTATEMDVQDFLDTEDRVEITSIGYRNGSAGP